MCGSRNFCQFYLVLSLFYSLQRGFDGFIAEKTILIFTKDPEGVHYLPGGMSNFFQGGGDVKLFPWGGGGSKCLFLSKPIYVLVIFHGGGCPDPLSPSGSAHGQCHHNGTIFITVPLLTIIVRH